MTDDASAVPWEMAPETSHILKYRWIDAREHHWVRDDTRNPGDSQLQVVFINRKTGKISNPFAYYFRDHDQGFGIYDEVRRSPHPHGEVLWVQVIKPKLVDYQELDPE